MRKIYIDTNKKNAQNDKNTDYLSKKANALKSTHSLVSRSLFLQRKIGNQAIQNLANSRAAQTNAKCPGTRSHAIFILSASGIGIGATYLKAGSIVEFNNSDTKTHSIQIIPALFSDNSFIINAGGKMVSSWL